MSREKYEGIIKALEYAMLTRQSVNVGIINDAGEGEKIEGVIKKVEDDSFRIKLDETGLTVTMYISVVEYVEYS